MKIVLATLVSLLGLSANAAIPPYWDSVNQIEAVLKSSEVYGKLFGAITSVKSLGNYAYQVNTNFCQGTVTLEVHPPSAPGANSYTFKSISDVVCE
jgi:hypothetical protein